MWVRRCEICCCCCCCCCCCPLHYQVIDAPVNCDAFMQILRRFALSTHSASRRTDTAVLPVPGGPWISVKRAQNAARAIAQLLLSSGWAAHSGPDAATVPSTTTTTLARLRAYSNTSVVVVLAHVVGWIELSALPGIAIGHDNRGDIKGWPSLYSLSATLDCLSSLVVFDAALYRYRSQTQAQQAQPAAPRRSAQPAGCSYCTRLASLSMRHPLQLVRDWPESRCYHPVPPRGSDTFTSAS